jgi:hypothetical protein
MATNPYIGKKGNFNAERWLRDAQGQFNLDKRFIGYATSQGYRIGWDRDTTAKPGTAFGGANLVGTFQLRNANYMKGGVQLRPEIGLYGPASGSSAGGGSSDGSGAAGSGFSYSGGASGGGGSDPSAAFASTLAQITASNNALLKKIAGNKGPQRELKRELRDSQKRFSDLQTTFRGDMDAQAADFRSQFDRVQSAAQAEREAFQTQLLDSRRQFDLMQSRFQQALADAEGQRIELDAKYREELRRAQAVANAYVPEPERTAVAPVLGDGRTTQQAMRPIRRQSLSNLSLATNRTLQLA